MAGKLKNCPECGKLFMDMGAKMCRDCLDHQEKVMTKIASFVREHPNSTVKDIVEGVEGAKERLVRRMIQEGWFIQEGGSKISYPCEKCGALIQMGRFCEKCDAELKKDVMKVQKNAAEKAVQSAQERKPMGTGFRSKDMRGKN